MSTSPLTLTQLPVNDVLEILKRCDIESILVLRKTCHDLRNLIDDSTTDRDLLDVSIDFFGDTIGLTLWPQLQHDKKLSIQYSETETGCLVSSTGYYSNKRCVLPKTKEQRQTRKLFKNKNFVDIFLQDFQIILNIQRKMVGSLHLQLSFADEAGLMEKLENFLQKNQLKAKEINIRTARQMEIIQILANFDSEYLETIKITYPYASDVWAELIELDQWKSAKNLEIPKLDLEKLNDCSHFSTLWVYRYLVHLEDVILVKQKFLESPSLTNFFINFEHIEEIISETLGPNHHVISSDFPPSVTKFWFFELENSKKCLCLVLSIERSTLKLSYINRENVPCERFIKKFDENQTL